MHECVASIDTSVLRRVHECLTHMGYSVLCVPLSICRPFCPVGIGCDIVTPGKRLAREITESWVRHCGSQAPVVTTPRVTTVDSWLERAWLQAVEAGRLPSWRLLTPQQDLAVWQQLIRDDLEERLGFSLTHPRAAAQRAQAAWNKLLGTVVMNSVIFGLLFSTTRTVRFSPTGLAGTGAAG